MPVEIVNYLDREREKARDKETKHDFHFRHVLLLTKVALCFVVGPSLKLLNSIANNHKNTVTPEKYNLLSFWKTQNFILNKLVARS